MALYTPAAFVEADRTRIRSVVARNSFATLVSGAEGGVQITHAPLQWDEARNVLTGHIARANPHAALFTPGAIVTVVFHGAHGYVSPTWYVDENPKVPNVPTWNYAVVHMTGTVTLLDDAAAKWAIVSALSAEYEGDGPTAWAQGGIGGHSAKLGAIVGFEIAVTRVDAKFKLSQNRSAADQAAVIARLEASGREDDAIMAQWMREGLA